MRKCTTSGFYWWFWWRSQVFTLGPISLIFFIKLGSSFWFVLNGYWPAGHRAITFAIFSLHSQCRLPPRTLLCPLAVTLQTNYTIPPHLLDCVGVCTPLWSCTLLSHGLSTNISVWWNTLKCRWWQINIKDSTKKFEANNWAKHSFLGHASCLLLTPWHKEG